MLEMMVLRPTTQYGCSSSIQFGNSHVYWDTLWYIITVIFISCESFQIRNVAKKSLKNYEKTILHEAKYLCDYSKNLKKNVYLVIKHTLSFLFFSNIFYYESISFLFIYLVKSCFRIISIKHC